MNQAHVCFALYQVAVVYRTAFFTVDASVKVLTHLHFVFDQT